MINEAKSDLEELDSIPSSTGFNRGNFTKADSDAVQQQIDEALEFINEMSNGDVKSGLLSQVEAVQKEFDEKVEARYVYYEIVKDETSMSQLTFSLSGDFWTTSVPDRLEGNPVVRFVKNNDNTVTVKYMDNYDWNTPEVGDSFSVNMRFNDVGLRNIDIIFTNLGDGKWDIHSDWLVKDTELE